MIGHLRDVKDPFRAAEAARRARPESRLGILHIGGALTEEMGRRAELENTENPRYRWIGERPRWQTVRFLARSRLVALTSRVEGGANVLCESLACGVPVVASRISGSIGLLGKDYPGYFPFGNTASLAALFERCERDSDFYNELCEACKQRASIVELGSEREAMASLLGELGN